MRISRILWSVSIIMVGGLFAIEPRLQSPAVIAPVPPVIDGALEEAWNEGVKFDAFTQITPSIGSRATIKTEIYFLYDRENIYIAGKIHQPRESILVSRARRDSSIIWQGDYIMIGLDPVLNANNAYFFVINPSNAVMDGTLDDLGEFNTVWDAIVDSATSVSAEFWSFEIRIPLTSISFQEREVQDWGIMFSHFYANGREKTISQLLDRNQPFRILAFHRIRGLKGLKRKTKIALTPYAFFAGQSERGFSGAEFHGKTGGDLKFRPAPSTSISFTLHPDYAQLETDREVINVTDLPTTYPEKRPFFTESSDMYPGLAVNTRNITDIRLGLKYRRVARNLKLDLTGVIDDLSQRWLLGNVRWSDNRSFHLEVITGLKSQEARTDYNVTTHLRTWFFKKQLTLYTWFGTINQPAYRGNDFESVNSAKWTSRTVTAGLWNHIKTKRYNPDIVGSPTLSNEVILRAWFYYSWIRPNGLFRVIKAGFNTDYYDLYATPNHSYVNWNISLEATLNLGERWGDWNWSLLYYPKANQKFRYREVKGYDHNLVFEDALGKFVLIGQPRRSLTICLKSDPSRPVGFSFDFSNAPVRQSRAMGLQTEIVWKPDPRAHVSYALNFMDIASSPFQEKYRQAIHRLQIEYNLTENLNVRAIIQSNRTRSLDYGTAETSAATNSVTLSWKVSPGSFLYFVYGRQAWDTYGAPGLSGSEHTRQTVILKFNRTFSF